MVPASAEHQQALVQGQANKDGQVTGMIPGTELGSEETNNE